MAVRGHVGVCLPAWIGPLKVRMMLAAPLTDVAFCVGLYVETTRLAELLLLELLPPDPAAVTNW